RLAVFSGAFELLGTVDGAAGNGAEFECVLPAGGGCAALDLPLPDFDALELAAEVFDAEFTVLAVELTEFALALAPASCALEPLAAVAVFFTGKDAEFDGGAGCAFVATGLATDADAAEAAFAAGRTSAVVVNTISTGASADGGGAADIAGAGARASVTATAAGVATLLVTGATAGTGLVMMLAGAELDATVTGAGVTAAAERVCAFAAACARVAALAGVLLLSSSSGGKFGNVL